MAKTKKDSQVMQPSSENAEKSSSHEDEDPNMDEEDGEEAENTGENAQEPPKKKKRNSVTSVSINQVNIKHLKVVEFREVVRLKREWDTLLPGQQTTPIIQYIPKEVRGVITAAFATLDLKVKTEDDWINWPADDILTKLLEWCPRGISDQTPGQTAEERILAANFKFPGTEIGPISYYGNVFNREYELWEKSIALYSEEEKRRRIHKLIESILKKLKEKTPEKSPKHILVTSLEKTKYDSGPEFLSEIMKHGREIINVVGKAASMGMVFEKNHDPKPNDRKRTFSGNHKNEVNPVQTNNGTNDPKEKLLCSGCGRAGHDHTKCGLRNHPDFNKNSNISWSQSFKGLEWKKKTDKSGRSYDTLPFDFDLEGRPFKDYDQSLRKKGNEDRLLSITTIKNNESLFLSFKAKLSKEIEVIGFAYLDTGAMTANYIAKDLLINLIKVKSKNSNITSVDKKTIKYFGSIDVERIILSKNNKNVIIKNEIFKIIESDIDMIIGLPTIKKYKLITKEFSEMFEESGDMISVGNDITGRNSLSKTCMDDGSDVELDEISEVESANNGSNIIDNRTFDNITRDSLGDVVNVSKNILLLIKSKEELLGVPEKIDDSEYPDENILGLEDFIKRKNENDIDIIKRIQFQSKDEVFVNSLKSLCLRYIDIFKLSLNKDPADIPPMEINVEDNLWEIEANRVPYRKQGMIKDKATLELVNEMLQAGIIRYSKANHWSQVLLVPKPNGEFRMCIDYRQLNKVTKKIQPWPMPNIQQMIDRIGSSKSKFYSKMDLTKGYFQAPLAEISRKYTAFQVHCGSFEFLRVPMGAKGSPSYFQYAISTFVLAGLLYYFCELYIDDILIHAKTQEQMLDNLTKVFQRLKERRISLNPDKCIFGAEEIEFVGHTINAEGIKITSDKKNKLLNFIRPSNMKGLKSFLGLANYFRDHIRNHSLIVKPLQNMISNYRKHKMLKWKSDGISSFEQIKQAISDAPLLYFVNDNEMIRVNTDASDYAIGGYLYQIINNQEKPISFISKTLNSCQRKWSTFDKEGYAIYVALKTWEYMLIGRKFLLSTDHKNLTYMRTSPSMRVNRWLTEIQHLDFDIEHVEGEKNVVADSFSRLIDADEEEKDNDEDSMILILKQKHNIPNDIHKCIGSVHNSTVGHHGVQRTINKLIKNDIKVDKELKEYIEIFIKKCPICQKNSQINPIINTIPFSINSDEPMFKVSVDTIGPLPISKLGNKHILVIVDSFTRWTEVYPMKSVEAKEAAQCFFDFFSRFGCPKEILSDNGTQFVNDLIDEFLVIIGSEHLLTIPYSKQENGMVERANKEVLRHLRNLIYDDKLRDEWDIALPLVRRILNATDHSSIGMSPAKLLFAGGIDLDRNIIKEFNKEKKKRNINDYLTKMKILQKKIVDKAIEVQLIKNQKRISKMKLIPTEFSIGDYVLVKYPDTKMGNKPPSKLHSIWQGPLKIIEKEGDKYSVLDNITGKLKDVHVTRLKLYISDYDKSPDEISAKDNEMFIVEKILDHHPKKINNENKYQAIFLVSWLNYSKEDNTWEPFELLENNEILHDYLRNKKLNYLIPKKYN